MKNKILLVEDDADFGFMLKQYLVLSDMDITWVSDPIAVRTMLTEGFAYDLIILDVMMPQISGFTLAQEIQTHHADIPFIFLTAKDQKIDRVTGLKLGADDYLTKPCDPEELVLRIHNILKRAHKKHLPEIITLGTYTFQPKKLLLEHEAEQIRLTEREAQLLLFLYSQNGELVTREQILQHVWGNSDFFAGRSMDVFITRLRKYLRHDPTLQINSLRGVGFKVDF